MDHILRQAAQQSNGAVVHSSLDSEPLLPELNKEENYDFPLDSAPTQTSPIDSDQFRQHLPVTGEGTGTSNLSGHCMRCGLAEDLVALPEFSAGPFDSLARVMYHRGGIISARHAMIPRAKTVGILRNKLVIPKNQYSNPLAENEPESYHPAEALWNASSSRHQLCRISGLWLMKMLQPREQK